MFTFVGMDYDYLERNWLELTKHRSNLRNEVFKELIERHSEKHRYYHGLDHIYVLLKYADHYDELLNDSQKIRFAIWFHDAIYDPARGDNEERSAELAKSQLLKLGVEQSFAKHCYDLIIATKKHEVPEGMNSFDAKFLLDIDLSILAAPRDSYIQYTEHIRKEYIMHPDVLYNEGRKKVLEHFLNMDKIYKTDLLRDVWEEKAKENLRYELSFLSS